MVLRRSVLRSGGVLLTGLLAGCQSSDSTGDGTTTTSPSTTQSTTTREPQMIPVGESATAGDGSVTITKMQAERSIVVLDNYSHTEVVTEADAQYLVVSMTTKDPIDGDDAARNAIELEVDGETHSVAEHTFPPAEDGGFNLAFRLPLTLEVTEARIVWNGNDGETLATWQVPDGTLLQLNNPPEFEVVSFNVPETATPFESFDVTVEVENTGEGDGTFVAELGLTSRSNQSTFRLDVPKGERVTGTEEKQVAGEAGETDTMVLDWGLNRLEHTIKIGEGTTDKP